MVTARVARAADKSQVCRKLVLALQKLYGKSVPRIEMPVVETMLFAACLEDNPWAIAEDGLRRLIGSYFDLNEIRVSSVSELQQTLSPLKDADWKGLRIRSILRYVFESTYTFDLEKLRRQTLEQAVKTLKKVNDISPFIREFVLHEILGSHIVCMDASMLTAAQWLGLVPQAADLPEASEFLRGGVRKADVSEFCYLLRCLATDPKFIPRFADPPDSEVDLKDVLNRLMELQSPPKKKPVKTPADDGRTEKPGKKSAERSPASRVQEADGTTARGQSSKPDHSGKTAEGTSKLSTVKPATSKTSSGKSSSGASINTPSAKKSSAKKTVSSSAKEPARKKK